jgi:hypothetical protein
VPGAGPSGGASGLGDWAGRIVDLCL